MTFPNAKGPFRDELVPEERPKSLLFQLDVLSSDQYFATTQRKVPLEPEKKLMLAFAESWILERNQDWILLFENICDMLGFDPQYIRQGLLRWKEKQLARRPAAKVYQFNVENDMTKPGAISSEETAEHSRKAASFRTVIEQGETTR